MCKDREKWGGVLKGHHAWMLLTLSFPRSHPICSSTLPEVHAVTEKKASIFPQSTIGDGVRIYNETSVSPGSEGGEARTVWGQSGRLSKPDGSLWM